MRCGKPARLPRRVSLYKVLLFIKIAQAIKGGVLNLHHSYKYRSLDDYLIPKQFWSAHRDAYLQCADLTAVAAFQPTLRALATRIDQQYHQTNQRILAGENPHVYFRKDGSFYVRTPKVEEENSEPLLGVLPQKRGAIARRKTSEAPVVGRSGSSLQRNAFRAALHLPAGGDGHRQSLHQLS